MKTKPLILCSHTLPSGSTCGVPASRGSRFCYHHYPDRPKPLRVVATVRERLTMQQKQLNGLNILCRAATDRKNRTRD